MEIERTVPHQGAAREVPHRQCDSLLATRGRRVVLLVEARQVAADHHRDQMRRAEFRTVERADVARVAQHRHAIGDLIDLLHAMADVDDRNSAPFQGGDHFEQPLGLARGQRCRRLVHDDDAGVGRERPGDLDHLPLAERQRRNARARRERQAELLQDRAAALADLGLVGNAEAARLVAQKDVLAHREVGSQRKLLIDDCDAIGPRGDRIAG